MSTTNTRRLIHAMRGLAVALAVASVTGLLSTPSSTHAQPDFVLAVHSSAGVTTLGIGDARRILSGRSTLWDNGVPVVIVLPPRNSEAMRWLVRSVVGLHDEAAYRRYLLGNVFAGRMLRPLETDTLADSRVRANDTRGAITALPRPAVSGNLRVVALH